MLSSRLIHLQNATSILLHRRILSRQMTERRILFMSSTTQKNLGKDNVVTVPNLLCLSRIAVSPYLAYLIASSQNYPMAFAFFGYAGMTDLLDGWIARNFKNQASMIGSFLDPLADKILATTLYLSLSYVGLIPAALTSLVVSRDILLVYAGLYIRYMSVEPPFTFRKYFDVTLPSAQVLPTTISKVNTAFQFALVGAALSSPIFGFEGHPVLTGLMMATAGTTLASSVSYAFAQNTYKFSKREYDHQAGKKKAAFTVFIIFNVIFAILFPPEL